MTGLGMMKRVVATGFIAAGITVIAAGSAFAADEIVLRGSQLTEENLINALTPTKTRSIKVMRDQPAGANAAAGDTGASPKVGVLITFVTNSSELTDSARDRLDVVGRALQAQPLAGSRFSIEGHADPRGESDYNQRLSEARAERVVSYLSREHGIPAERLAAIGKGDKELMNTRNIAAEENRRVMIVNLQ